MRGRAKRITGAIGIIAALTIATGCISGGTPKTQHHQVLACVQTQERIGAAHNVWETTAATFTARYHLGATTGCDGRLYAIGGLETQKQTTNAAPVTDDSGDAEAYDPQSRTWTALAPMPTPRAALGVATGKDGKIYAIGGNSSDSEAAPKTVEVYDPKTNTWADGTAPPVGLERCNATADAEGNIYVASAGVMAIYKPDKNTWAIAQAPPTSRDRPVMATGQDGNIYLMGGFSASGPVATAESYNPKTGQWKKLAPMPSRLGQTAGAAGHDGKIYVLGGSPDYAGQSSAVYAYTPSSNSWTTLANMPTARNSHAAAVGPDGRIYAINGDTGSTNQTDGVTNVEVYSP